ncbi:protein MULTIPOLAR SPINDLE 1-like isoform X7 [Salvia splendens]|uniref:protein MULTIPOLAR SPINDLE 1-like isoform X7 n=1 Tax=Salvia splendens TaxID=180675 RepID=UPI001C260C8C|nr:protein MULTIPOLAR SPINDLE 1-like isoform X7 [Salvia splendens]
MENSTIELDPSLKLAIAMALAHSRRRQGLPPSATTTSAHHDDSRAKSGDNSEADVIKWKNKAKQRKGEIRKLKEDLKIAEEGMQHDLFPQNNSCKCYFYDNLGQLSPSHGSYQDRINDVFHRRFLRQVRLAKRKKRRHNGLLLQPYISAALKDLSLGEKLDETTKSIVSCLIMRLMQMMCNGSQNDVSQRISMASESLLFMDPFDNAFPKMHSSIYLMIQLIEFLISDYLLSWSTRRDVDSKLLEDWVVYVFRAGKALELLESRNAVYTLYMDRVTGELTRLLGWDPFPQMLKPDTLGEQRGVAAAAEVEEDGFCKQEEGSRHHPTWWRPWKFHVSRQPVFSASNLFCSRFLYVFCSLLFIGRYWL